MLNNRLGTLLRMILRWKGHIWYRGYRKHMQEVENIKLDKPIDIIVLLVDHYEPAKKDGDKAVDTVIDWCNNYKAVSKEYVDSDGIHPQHSWFYRYDFPDFNILNALSGYVYDGFGEIEFHLHHGFDTSDTFNEKIESGIKWFNSSGAMISAEKNPKHNFAYIAGNWALDNGRNDPQFSGVNDEIQILSRNGCYADFTFPAAGCTAQPEKVNSIYYAKDDPLKPKSYNTGLDVTVGGEKSGDLMIVQGPLYLDWENAYLEYAAFESYAPYFKDRLKYWLDAHVHVKSKPEWVFVKLHTHGMQSKSIYANGNFKDLCSDLSNAFDEKDGFRLHYVTSREAYNIIKAAEKGLSGNPNDYRNYEIKEPANKNILVNKPYTLVTYTDEKIIISIEHPACETEILIRSKKELRIFGDYMSKITVILENGLLASVETDGKNCKYEEI